MGVKVGHYTTKTVLKLGYIFSD